MRRQIRRSWIVPGSIAALLAATRCLSAPAADPPGSATGTASEVTGALLLPQDRQAEQWLDAARRAVESRDFGTASVLLQRTLAADEDSFVAGSDSSLVPARIQALQLATRLPEETRARFEADLDRIAREAWSATRQGSVDAISAFANRYRASEPGLQALRLLAAMHHDGSRHQQAAAAWLAVMRHPRATQDQRSAAGVACVEALLAAGQFDAAEQMARNARWTAEPVVIAGQQVVAGQWIQQRLKQARPDQPGSPAPLADGIVSPWPALQPVWSRELPGVAELQKSVTQIERYYREQGVVSAPVMRPVVAGNIALTRTLQELMAFDVSTGEHLWSVPNQEYSWLFKRPVFLENSPFRTATAAAWHRRVESDSLFAAIATDGQLVMIVQEPDRSNQELASTIVQGRAAAPDQPVASSRWNRLCGFEVATRQLRWQIGGPPTGPADVLGGISFLGAPLVVDDDLFVVARRDDELRLLALDRQTGHLRWSLKLGVVAPHLADAISRRRIACPVTWSDGLLVCATASGMAVAVNPATRSIAWACRYPVVLHDLPVRPMNGASAPFPPDVWWNEWREVACLTGEVSPGTTIILFASPDSNQLLAIRAADGSVLWSAPRAGGLHVVGTTSDTVLVGESMAVRAHDLRTGRMRWRAETGEISGRAALAGNQVFQPRRAGGIAVVNVSDGSHSEGLSGSDTVYGALIPSPGGWLTQANQTLFRLPLLESVRRRTAARAESDPTGSAAVELARLELQGGDAQAALSRLAKLASDEAKPLQREAILALLRSGLKPGRPAGDREVLGRKLLELSESDDERLVALYAVGEAARAAGDSVAALTSFLDGLELADAIGLRSIGDWPADPASNRTVRADRLLAGSIRSLLAEDPAGSSRTSQELQQILQSRLEAARQSTDRFAVQRLIDRLLPLEWARRSLLADPAAVLYALPLDKAEPLLLSVAGSRDRRTAVAALARLTELRAKSGWRDDAETLQRQMLFEFPGIPLPGGKTLAATLQSQPDLNELHGRLLAPIADAWPAGVPLVERETRRHLDVYNVPVRVQAPPGGMFDRLDVSVDRLGRIVRFSCDGYAGTWEKVLPGSPRALRSAFANLDQVEAWGVGRLLVLRIGSEVFGILPFNERGEPQAEVTPLQLDIASANSELPSEAWWHQEPVPARLGIRHEGTRLVDGFGRTMGGLGPVRATYLCYRSQARLVAVDTRTGRRLWERLDLPTGCQILGDDDCVYLWRTDEESLQVLSAIDGRVLGERSWQVSPDDVLMHRDSLVWSVVRQPVPGIELTDLRNGSVVWSKQFAANAVPFAMDQTAVGVIEPGGLLHLLAAGTGAPLGEPLTVDVPQRIERVVCLHDQQRWYIAISGPVPRLTMLQGEQLWGGLRLSFVSGWLYGIPRQTAAIAWRRFLDAEPLPLSASHVAPVLVQMWRRSAADGSGAIGILRAIDVRTGAEILTHRDASMQPYFALLPAENREKLDIHTERETFRLNFVSDTQQPQPRRADGNVKQN